MRFLLPIICIFCNLANAQESQNSIKYQSGNIGNYVGTNLVVKTEERYNLINKVFSSQEDLKNKKVSFPDKHGITKRDSLIGKVFYVNGAFIDRGERVEKVKGGLFDIYYLEVFDKVSDKKYYIKYFYDNSLSFPFYAYPTIEVISKHGVDYANIYRNALEYYQDDFTGEKTISSPSNLDIENNKNFYSETSPLRLMKSKLKNGVIKYYLLMYAHDFDLTVSEKGAWVLFSDGSKLSKPMAKIGVNSGYGRHFTYSCKIPITLSEFNLFKSKKVKKTRLYIHEEDMSSVNSTLLPLYAKEIINYKL